MTYDLLIIGGGPAGAAAGVYAARKKLKTVLITENFYGQSVASAEIQNWIGAKSISGMDLARNMEEHVKSYDIEIAEGDLVEKIIPLGTSDVPNIEALNSRTSEVQKLEKQKSINGFRVITKSGKSFETKTILVASGGRHRKLGVPGEEKFDGKGMVYCATCDAPMFNRKAVAVIGAGNAGLEAARDLLSYATKVYILEFTDKIFGDPVIFEVLKKDPRVEVIMSVEVKEVFGDLSPTKDFVGDDLLKGLKYADRNSGEVKELAVEGIFVEIGSVPNSEIVKDLVSLNKKGEIEVDAKTQRASLAGIWAAGDVCDTLYKQNNIAVGDAIKAVLDIQEYLNKR